MSGSFDSLRWNVCVHILDLGLYSHPKDFCGNGVRTHVNSKGKIPSTRTILLRGGLNPRRCIKQDNEPNALPTELFRPQTCDPSPACSRSNPSSDFQTDPPVATVLGVWWDMVSAGTGWPGVSIL